MKNIGNLEVFKYEKKEGLFFVNPPYTKFLKNDMHKEMKIQEEDLEILIKDLLLVKNCKVEEYENGRCTKEGFPGNWKDFTDLCLDHRLPPSLCSLKISGNKVDLCFIKTTESFLNTCIFEDDDVYSNLYTILSEINAYEIIYDDKNLVFIENMGIITHLYDKAEDSVKLMKKFLKIDLITIKPYFRPNVCIIDDNTLEALNIHSSEKCVLSLFNCYTIQGKRLLLQFFKQPLKNIDEIEARLDIIEVLRDIDFDILKDFPDLLKITKKITKISLLEILKLHQVTQKIPILLSKMQNPLLINDFYTPLNNINIRNILNDIEEVIDVKNSQRNIIKFNKKICKITELYSSLDEINKKCQNEYLRLIKLSDKIKYTEGEDFFKITRIEYKKSELILKNNNVLVTSVLKTGVNFTTKRMSELSLERNNIKECINKETSKIVNDLRNKIQKYINEFEIFNYIVALIDVFSAIGRKSRDIGYTRPKFINYSKEINEDKNYFDNSSQLEIIDGFHPILEDKNFITNCIKFDKTRLCIITGPNMGGKSTFLKMIGVISVLAQVGCYVPAKYTILPIFDGIYIRIGANDCTYKGSSTFMVEMKDIARICRMCTNNSLVLIDELGRGTSEIDGLSIAKAVRDFLFEKKCITLFATHFPELCDAKTLNKKAQAIQLALTYKIVDGICDTSWGLNVAKLVNFPDSVIKEIENQQN